jgi:hypothetical protein
MMAKRSSPRFSADINATRAARRQLLQDVAGFLAFILFAMAVVLWTSVAAIQP